MPLTKDEVLALVAEREQLENRIDRAKQALESDIATEKQRLRTVYDVQIQPMVTRLSEIETELRNQA